MNSAVCLLERAYELYPDNKAVSDANVTLTYRELRRRARNAASSIIKRLDRRSPNGLIEQRNARAPIMVYLPKSADMITGFCAAMYAGRPYVPTDINAPRGRLEKIIENLAPAAVITDREHLAKMEGAPGEPGLLQGRGVVFLIDELTEGECSDEAIAAALDTVTDSNPIYIMYTSGSTGTPKGVTIPHRGVLLFARWAERTFGWTSETVIANQAPLHFDVSVMDVYGAMRCGGHLIITPEALFHFPNKLPEFLRDNAVTHIYWVPTVMINVANSGALEGVDLPALRSIAFAGEVMPNKQLNVWRRALPGRIFANLYGPTETDVCTAYVVDRDFDDAEPLPIGSPLPDMRVLLLDENGRRVKDGETGEICVSGSGILLGYWNDPEKTASSVFPDPDNRAYPTRYYRTGDLGWLNDRGELMYSGRRDGQIKLHGNRIELGEVEAAARMIPGAENVCAVFDREKKEIVLFVESAAQITKSAARRAMRGNLPAYMMPERVETMTALPHNANDKIDRVALTKWLEDN